MSHVGNRQQVRCMIAGKGCYSDFRFFNFASVFRDPKIETNRAESQKDILRGSTSNIGYVLTGLSFHIVGNIHQVVIMSMSYEHEFSIRRQLGKNIVDSVYTVSKVIKEVWKSRG